MEYSFFVPGTPTGKGRPRFSVVQGRVVAYTPKSTKDVEKMVAKEFRALKTNHGPESGNVKIFITAVFDIPKSYTKAKRELALAGKIYPTKKPDIDNITKLVMDALNGLAYYDDSQVTVIHAVKRYSMSPSDPPGIHVCVGGVE